MDVTDGGHSLGTVEGSLGLAPAWLERGMTLGEKRWVSACIFARTNYFGVPMQISMRGEGTDAPGLQVTPDELRAAPLFEGGFFGNVFAPGRPAYVCTPGGSSPMDAKVMRYRVCALPSGRDELGRPVTACGFVVRGPCSAPATFDTEEGRYREVIEVYLDPDGVPEPTSAAPASGEGATVHIPGC